MAYLYEKETYQIIGAAQEVHKELGSGFLEAVYQDSMEMELKERQILFKRECPLDIFFKKHKLPRTYYADFVCYEKIIVETKAVKALCEEHYAQALHYLKATGFRLALLINFGEPSLKVKRIIL
jgi:GxxExxY protein